MWELYPLFVAGFLETHPTLCYFSWCFLETAGSGVKKNNDISSKPEDPTFSNGFKDTLGGNAAGLSRHKTCFCFVYSSGSQELLMEPLLTQQSSHFNKYKKY